MTSIQSLKTSYKKIKKIPTTDPQDKKVYQMDFLISEYLKNKKPKFDTKLDFLELSKSLFEAEGFSGYSILDNQSKKVSFVNHFSKKLTFSSIVIKERNYEVIFHELAHCLSRFRSDYTYSDFHGGLFIYFLFHLIEKYYDVDIKKLEDFADQCKVIHFNNSNIKNKEISKSEYSNFIKDCSYLEQKESRMTKKSNQIIHSGVDLKRERFLSLYRNNEKYFMFERNLFRYEEVIYISMFNTYNKPLNNIYIISPMLSLDVNNDIVKGSRYSGYFYTKEDTAKDGLISIIKDENKNQISKSRKSLIKDLKRKGFEVILAEDYTQFSALQIFFEKRLINI